MDLLGSFIATHQPSDIALINWISQTGIIQIWADPRDTTDWPTSTRGVMSVNMEAAVGAMIFDKCWSGYFTGDKGPWMVCGLSNDQDLWGYLIVHWHYEADVPPSAQEHLRILAARLERILFN